MQVNPNNADGVDATLDGSASIESDNDLRVHFQPNIFDPIYWDGLDQKQVMLITSKGYAY